MAPPRIKWKVKYITALRKLLRNRGTSPIIIDILCTAITEYLDTGSVIVTNYHHKFHNILQSQSKIGWRQILLGRLSQEWSKRHSDLTNNPQEALLWEASIIELSLRYTIILWEERNKAVHGHTQREQNRLLVHRHRDEITRLHSLKHSLRPSDAEVLFKGINNLLKSLDPTVLNNWIATRRPAIYQSIKRAKTESVFNTKSLLNWLTPATRNPQRQRWILNKLLHDPYSKKKRHKKSVKPTTQSSITPFLTLRDVL